MFYNANFDFAEGFVSYSDVLLDALMLFYYARLSSRRDPVLESEFLVFAEGFCVTTRVCSRSCFG